MIIFKVNTKVKDFGVHLRTRKSFALHHSRNIHMKRHNMPKNVMCDKCCKTFLRASELWLHLQTHKDTKEFMCSKCSKEFRYKSDLNRHNKTCGSYVQCPECPKQLKSHKNLQDHLKTKHVTPGKYKYYCELCETKPWFQYWSSLRNHKDRFHKNFSM